MKFKKSLLFVGTVFALFLCVAPFVSVSAETPMTDQQIELIKENCVSAKNTLSQLHASDALLRVNMGEMYESLSTKLMNNFNTRVSNNHFNSFSLVGAMNTYNSSLDTFRSDYRSYEESLSSALGIDCLKQPVSFYDAVANARNNRDRVHGDVVKLNENIDNYGTQVSQFAKDYQLATEGLKL